MIAELLAEIRAKGIELRIDGTRLKVAGDPRGYSPALRAKLLANKPEIVAHLRREAESAGESYARAVRAWEVDYVKHLARGRGYSEKLARIAAELVAKRPCGEPFTIGADIIVVSMGAGLEVRVHRAPQAWAATDGSVS